MSVVSLFKVAMASTNSSTSYEQIRKHRLEENKKRMEELGLTDLSKSLLHNVSPISKSSASRQVRPRTVKETVIVELRRSSRVANSPLPDYREVDADIPIGRRRSHFQVVSASRSSLLLRKYASDDARIHAADRAERLQKELDPKNPSFVKLMLQSHVSGGFWMGLPSFFCKTYLPGRDGRIVLEDENCEEWETVYLAYKNGLSGGWRGFSLDHGLQDGDALVFELVQCNRFKVYIVRSVESGSDIPVEEKNINLSNNEVKNTWEDKRKQTLVMVRSDSEDESESKVVNGCDGRGSRKKQKFQVKDEVVEALDSLQNVTKKMSEDQNEQFEEDKISKDDSGKVKKQKPLTGMLRSKKPQRSITHAKKDMIPSREVIEAY
eukprot:c20909_g1_i1 orf=292-1428(+)